MQMTYKQLKDEIEKIIPRNIEYTVDLEAGNIAIITSQMGPFTGPDGLIGKIARRIKRKIVLRTPIDKMMPMDDAKEFIENLLPQEAEVSEMYFDGCYREVTIQCQHPGKAIGRKGENNKKIRDQTGCPSRWSEPLHCSPKQFTTSECTVSPLQTSDANCSKTSA